MKKISNKGFTLIELLATILIIGLVLGITTYGIIISVNKAKEKSTNLSLTSIKEAARTYSGELGEDSWKNGDKNTYFCVTIEELINKGLLNKKCLVFSLKISTFSVTLPFVSSLNMLIYFSNLFIGF